MNKLILFLISLLCIVACTNNFYSPENKELSDSRVLSFADVEWEQLNPARGDKSPKAATLWGERTGPGPAGFLLKPVDGFKSPPHIHNVAYRGVVISGLLHNDHPDAEMLWMKTGSFWTQPEGGVHITAAKGDDALAYIEVEDGFGVLPAKEAFESKDKAINLEASKISWKEIGDKVDSATTAMTAYLWGSSSNNKLAGRLLMLPDGYHGKIIASGSVFRVVLIQGVSDYQLEGSEQIMGLKPGSYFSANRESVHKVRCNAESRCILYVRSNKMFDLKLDEGKS